jgi:hypothetical protein
MSQNPYQSPPSTAVSKGAWRAFWRRLCIGSAIFALAAAVTLASLESWLGESDRSPLAAIGIGFLALLSLIGWTSAGFSAIGWTLCRRPSSYKS